MPVHILPDTSIFLGNISQDGSTAITTGSGAVALNGSTSLASHRTFTADSGDGYFDFSAATGPFKTTTGDGYFLGSSNTFTSLVDIRDNVSPLDVLFQVANSDGTVPYAQIGANQGSIGSSSQLFWQSSVTGLIGPNGSLIFLEGTNPSGGNFYQGSVLDNGVQVGHSFNVLVNGTLNPITQTGALLSKFMNNSVIKFVIDKDGKIGASATNAHTIPNVTGDTFALLTAAQNLSSKTLTSPIISAGLTASGSASNDFSGSTGTFKTSTGASTFGGSSNTFSSGAIGATSGQQHIIPSVTSDTLALLGATQTWTALNTFRSNTRYQALTEATSAAITNNSAAGTTRVDYLVVERNAQNNATVGSYVSTVTSNATLNNTISYTLGTGAVTADIYRFNSTAAGNAGTTGSIATGLTASASFTDTGSAASAYTLPAFNGTAQSIFDSPISVGTATTPVNMITVGGSLAVNGIGQPTGPTYVGTGVSNSKNNSYFIVPYMADGYAGAAGTATIFSGGPTQLSTTNYTTVSWSAIPGAIYYDVVTTSRASQDSAGNITVGLVGSKIVGTSFRDTGIVATAYNQNISINSGLHLRNTLASTSTQTQQVASGIQFESHAWKSTATAADQANYGYLGFRGITGAASTLGEFYLAMNQTGSGTWAEVMKITGVGNGSANLTLTGLSALTIQSSASQALIINGSASVNVQHAGTTVAVFISGVARPLTDSQSAFGTAGVRWDKGYFGKSISVLPNTVEPSAAIHVTGGNILSNAHSSTGITSITQGGTPGSTSYTYLIVAKDSFTNKTLGSATTATATGASTLTGTNTNIITWTAIPGPGSGGSSGQVSYDVIRYATAGTGNSGTTGSLVVGNIGTTYTDTGIAASAYTAPTYNATADITSDGRITSGFLAATSPAITVGTGVTNYTVANPPAVFKATGAAHVALTASTEFTDVLFDLSAIKNFKTGTITTQRVMHVRPPTYSFVGASTITQASTLSIEGAPIAGTNATITESLSLFVQAGSSKFQADAVGTAQTTGVSLINTTAATSGSQQYSPLFVLAGDGYGTTAGTSQVVQWGLQNRPVQAAVADTDLVFWRQVNGGGYLERLKINGSSGTIITASTSVRLREGTNNNGFYADNAIGGVALQIGAVSMFTLTTSAATYSAGINITSGIDSVGGAQTVGRTIQNTTAATVSVQQSSPVSMLLGKVWETTGGTSQAAGWGFQAISVSSTVATSRLGLISNVNGTLSLDGYIQRSGAAADGIQIQSPTGTSYVKVSAGAGGFLGWGTGYVGVNAATVELKGAGADGAGAIAATVGPNSNFVTAGASQLVAPTVRNATQQGLLFCMTSHAGVHCYGEELTTSGTVAAGDIVVWAGTDGKSVATAGASANLTGIAGVAVTGAVTGTVIRVARMGRVRVNCETTVNATGLLVGTSGSTAGRAKEGTPGSGALVGCSVCAAGATINSVALGANQVIIDLLKA